jgi:hypothetical protein
MKQHLLGAAALLALAGCGEMERNMSAEEVADKLASVKIEPGQWEATQEIISVEAPNMPPGVLDGMVGQKTKVSNCVTPELAAQPDANFLAAQENANCAYENFSMSGGEMKGRMVCQGGETPGRMEVELAGEYGSTSYDMTMDMKTSGLPGGMGMAMKARTTGKRVGECT